VTLGSDLKSFELLLNREMAKSVVLQLLNLDEAAERSIEELLSREATDSPPLLIRNTPSLVYA
jgi:hypothetical protein